jgi:putative sugar O-methyltransferase
MRNNPALLDLMLAAEASQPALYRPGPYWIGNQRRAVAAIRQHGIANFRDMPAIAKGYGDAIPVDPSTTWDVRGWRDQMKIAATRLPFLRDVFASYVKLAENHARRAEGYYADYFECRFGPWLDGMLKRFELPEMAHGGAKQRLEYGGKTYNPLYLEHLMRIDNFAGRVNFGKVGCMMEIGGGFGANLHLLLSMYPNIRKVFYLDIPPVIYVATEYLRHFFGAAVRDFSVTRTAETISFRDDDSLEIFCLCPWQIEKLGGRLDLFWNSASLSEMPPPIVSNYASRVSRLLAPASSVCLVLNKNRNDEITTRPGEVLESFPGVEFEDFTPAVELRGHGRYVIGRRQAVPDSHVAAN